MIDEEFAVALIAVVGVDDDVFEEDNETSDSGGDGEEEVDHADDALVGAEDKNAAPAGFLEDETDAAVVGGVVRGEVALEVHELRNELDEGGEIFDGHRFDPDGGARGSKISGRSGHGLQVAVLGEAVRWKFPSAGGSRLELGAESFQSPDNQPAGGGWGRAIFPVWEGKKWGCEKGAENLNVVD